MRQEVLYNSSFIPSPAGMLILEGGNILIQGETPALMVERVINDLVGVEEKFHTNEAEIKEFANELGGLMDSKKIVFSTPIMTNASRIEKKPLSACAVPMIDLKKDFDSIKKVVDSYHKEAMGTGFNLDETEDPVSFLEYLNSVAVVGAKSGKEDRPVGNIAICKINHPKIIDFILSKRLKVGTEWKFNISIDTPQTFWESVENGDDWVLRNGEVVSANKLLKIISESVYDCADPGIVFLDRLNADNPTPGVGLYTATAPCAEVGLVPGETCQFGYINVAKFIDSYGNIDYKDLAKVSAIMLRSLDNAVELSIDRYSIQESAKVMFAKRKVGVGVCGIADMLISLGIPYSSKKARELCRDILSFINFQTKITSVKLAKTRGSFGAMTMKSGCRYNDNPGFIEEKYGNLETNTVSPWQWQQLGNYVRKTRLLRNSSTTALPPTGRSGLIIGASTGIEPLFSLSDGNHINDVVKTYLSRNDLADSKSLRIIKKYGSCQTTDFPEGIKNCLKTAVEIHSFEHLQMICAVQQCIDESVSKTINLPECATVDDIKDIYFQAYSLGLKGITVYRDGSLKSQPKKLSLNN